MKKIASVFLVLAIFMAMMSATTVFAANEDGSLDLSIQTTSAKVGEEVTVEISAANIKNICGFVFNFQYDNQVLECLSFEATDFFKNNSNMQSALNFKNELGRFIFTASRATNWTSSEDGVIAVAKFRVKETAQAGFTAVTIHPTELFELFNEDFVDLQQSVVNGGVNIEEVTTTEPTTEVTTTEETTTEVSTTEETTTEVSTTEEVTTEVTTTEETTTEVSTTEEATTEVTTTEETTTTTPDDDTPTTGDSSKIAFVSFALLLSMATVVVLTKKSKSVK